MSACITVTAFCSVLRISYSCCILVSRVRVVVLYITCPCCCAVYHVSLLCCIPVSRVRVVVFYITCSCCPNEYISKYPSFRPSVPSIRVNVLSMKYPFCRDVYYYSKYPCCRPHVVYHVRVAVLDILISIHVKHIALLCICKSHTIVVNIPVICLCI